MKCLQLAPVCCFTDRPPTQSFYYAFQSSTHHWKQDRGINNSSPPPRLLVHSIMVMLLDKGAIEGCRYCSDCCPGKGMIYNRIVFVLFLARHVEKKLPSSYSSPLLVGSYPVTSILPPTYHLHDGPPPVPDPIQNKLQYHTHKISRCFLLCELYSCHLDWLYTNL